jgi:hypothetical protein
MPDITMCRDEECPFNKTCFRFTSKPSNYQSYFKISPRKNNECEYYYGVPRDIKDSNIIKRKITKKKK